MFTVSSGEGFQYDAESGPEIVDCITNIIQDVVIQANLIGNVTDVIDSAFYPVDKSNGMPLSHGDSITLEGNKTSQNDDNAAGQVVNDNGVWKIVWNDQKFDWPTTDEDGNIILPGWHGTVYVKSKEDFLGGNGISTNGDGSIVEAVRYVDHAENEVELPNSETGNSVELSTPYVNVDELTFSENDTEWTVYLGTEVEPLKEIQALFEEIKVYEVVSKTTGDHVIADDGQMIYLLSSNDIADGREEVNEREHFPLKNIAPLSDEQWSQLIGGDSVEIDYNAYGHTKIGTIKIELDQVVGTGEDDLTPSPHVTTMTGTPVETYKLTVSYLPKDADVSNFHTGSYGTKRPGDDTDDIVSQNTHKINVYATPLEIEKVDEKGNLLSDAVFTLYKTDDENGSSVNGLDSTQRYIAVATATSGEKGIARLEKIGSDTNYDLVYGETYYLLETEAPSYHAKNDTVWTVTVQTENGKYTDLDGESFSSTSGITDEMYPFNWDQDAMILVNSNPAAVITNEETEGITTSDSSFVSHEDVICFRYKVENNFLKVEKEIPVKKVLKGRDMEEGEFSFVLQAISISGIRDDDSSKQVIYNPKGNANDEIEFPFTLKYDTNSVKNAPYYDTAGHAVYFYVVYEEQGEVDDIIYSDLQYIVKVTLSEEGNKLVATPEYYKYDGDGALPNAATVNLQESA